MAKKFLFSFLFCIHFGGLTNLFALNSTFLPDKSLQNAEECHAPPPDSFHMTAAGAHFVSLAWHPVWVGATHTLVVLKIESDGATWLPIDTFPTIIGDSFTVTNLLYGSKYRFSIATNCVNGDPSDVQAFTGPPSGLILDLVLDGRAPINPSVHQPCSNIQYENYNWVGFRIAAGQNLGAVDNFFEFAVGEDGVPLVKRVTYGPHIVATDLIGHFPQHPPKPSIIELDDWEFLIKRVDGAVPGIIGKLRLTYNPISNPKTVKICMVNDPPWSPGYSFTMHTAQAASGMPPISIIDRNDDFNPKKEKFAVENPVNEYLNLFPLESSPLQNAINIRLINMTGQIVMSQQLEFGTYIPSIPVPSLSAGPYILRIDSENDIQILKVIKL